MMETLVNDAFKEGKSHEKDVLVDVMNVIVHFTTMNNQKLKMKCF
jgi:ribosomal silencing factor RsfS